MQDNLYNPNDDIDLTLHEQIENLENDIENIKLNLANLQYDTPHYSGAKIYTVEDSIQPRRAHLNDAGLDIAIQEDCTLQPYSSTYIRAGVKLDLPEGLGAMVMTRSGTPRKHMTVVPTLIDSNYKEEISTVLSNFTSEEQSVEKGQYLAQVVLVPILHFDNESEQFEQTSIERQRFDRFGSSDLS